MQVTIFQDFCNQEPFFWTKDEIDKFNLDCDSEEDRNFKINDIEYIWKFINENEFRNLNFKFEDGCNIVVIHERNFDDNSFESFINYLSSTKGTEKKIFLVFTKETEDYWVSYNHRHDENFLKKIDEIGNVKVIWDVPYFKLNNFIFSPKVQIQSYFSNSKFNGDAYYWGRDVFLKYPKDFRVGLHINKIWGPIRYYLVQKLKNYKNENFFYTINSNCPYNKHTDFGDLNSFTNFKSSIYTSKLMRTWENGFYNNWYTSQFFEMGIKSHMEIVYETFPYFNEHLWLVKWNEKTIKQLYLGKPFIHADPISHKLMYENEMIPYRSLYTNELWEIYDNWDIHKKNDYDFIENLIQNINWLCNMEENEWLERINDAMIISEINKNKVDKLIFETSLIDVIKSNL